MTNFAYVYSIDACWLPRSHMLLDNVLPRFFLHWHLQWSHPWTDPTTIDHTTHTPWSLEKCPRDYWGELIITTEMPCCNKFRCTNIRIKHNERATVIFCLTSPPPRGAVGGGEGGFDSVQWGASKAGLYFSSIAAGVESSGDLTPPHNVWIVNTLL